MSGAKPLGDGVRADASAELIKSRGKSVQIVAVGRGSEVDVLGLIVGQNGLSDKTTNDYIANSVAGQDLG